MKKVIDLAVVGMGPAGYTASIYASRYKVENIIIGKLMGGLIGESHKVCNFPTEEEIPGLELMAKMQRHAVSLGAKELYDSVGVIKKDKDGIFSLETASSGTIYARSVVLATGLKHRKLNIPGEAEFTGRGVAYCATCDGFFYRGKTVAVIGGSDSAISAAVYLAEIAKEVYLIYRGSELKGEPAWIELAEKSSVIKILLERNLTEIKGSTKVEEIVLDAPYQGDQALLLDGIFVEIGAEPDRLLIDQLGPETSPEGYIQVDLDQSTNIPGAFAAGDITTGSNQFRQVITASSEGAIAAQSVFKYLSTQPKEAHSQQRMEKVTA